MFSYDLNTSYMQSPFAMPMPYAPTFQTPMFDTPIFGGYHSMVSSIPKYPIMSVFDYGTFGYTPTVESCYLGQMGINPPYNVFPYPINTIPPVFSFPTYTPRFDFGSMTNPFGNISVFQNKIPYTFGSITTGGNQWSLLQNRTYNQTKYNGKNPTINRALQLATAELGTTEVNGSNDSVGIRKYKNGAKNNLPWCGSFVSWLYGAGQGSNNCKTFGYSMHSQTIRRRAENSGFYSSKNSGYRPKVGDLMILKYSNNSGHIGIVTKVNSDGSFETIEGNQSNKVKRVHRTMNTAKLDGFVRMDDWLKAA